MQNRRDFLTIAAAAGAAAIEPIAAGAETNGGEFKAIKALTFDAYGTLFDVFSITQLGEQLFPGKGEKLAQMWRMKQLQYSFVRSLMGRHRDFWGVTEDALVWSGKSLHLDLTAEKKKRLLDAYLVLAAFPDVKPGLAALKSRGLKLAILSNGAPAMLAEAVKSAGIGDLLDGVISVEDVKIYKASPRVYNLALERLRVSRMEMGFVSSNSWDVSGAASSGLNTIWIRRNAADVPDELGFEASAVVAALTDVPPLLQS